MLMPSRRLMLFSAAMLILIAAPVVLIVVAAVRTVFIPPVRGARFIGYDGLHLDAACTNSPSAKGGQVLVCHSSFHIDSRFEIVNHDSAAVAWCIERIDESHINPRPAKHFGPLIVGTYPPIPPDWGGCTEMLPMQAGMYGQIIINH